LVPPIEHPIANRQREAFEKIALRRRELILAERVLDVLREGTLDGFSVHSEVARG